MKQKHFRTLVPPLKEKQLFILLFLHVGLLVCFYCYCLQNTYFWKIFKQYFLSNKLHAVKDNKPRAESQNISGMPKTSW